MARRQATYRPHKSSRKGGFGGNARFRKPLPRLTADQFDRYVGELLRLHGEARRDAVDAGREAAVSGRRRAVAS